jgi:hypothetical protein
VEETYSPSPRSLATCPPPPNSIRFLRRIILDADIYPATGVGFAGEVNAIAIDAFNDSEILTAVKNGSGNLELIAWRCAPTDTEVTRVCDSGSQAGSIAEVALSVIGRTAITAVRNGRGNLFMILWDVLRP